MKITVNKEIDLKQVFIDSLFGFSIFMLGVIFLIGGIAMFTGWTWAHKWIAKIKYNKQLTKQGGKAMNKASDVNALTDFAGAVDAHKA